MWAKQDSIIGTTLSQFAQICMIKSILPILFLSDIDFKITRFHLGVTSLFLQFPL